MTDCCGNMLKYMIFLCNFVIFVTGCVVFGFGVAVHLRVGEFNGFLQDNYFHSSIVLMVAGGVILLVTFFGCCGTCTENPCMLYTFGTLLGLILLVEIGAAVGAALFKGEAEGVIVDAMTKGVEKYGKDNATTIAWDSMQTSMKCCGVKTFQDWRNSTVLGDNTVPDSCCISSIEGCGKGAMIRPEDIIFTEGCLSKFKKFISTNVVFIGAVAGAVVVLQFLGIIVVCCLANRMREQKEYV